jgi:glycosyltransferase involved in cell wall biosynthesis
LFFVLKKCSKKNIIPKLKILQVPFCFFPDRVGGTEIYVQALCRDLITQGVDCIVASPGEKSEALEWNRIPVRRFSISNQIQDVSDLYGDGDDLAAQEFEKILIDEKPDLVHLHAYTRAISLKLVNKIIARNLPVVFTYHTPTITCQRGTMLRWGDKECDGLMEPVKCTECSLHGNGLNKTLSQSFARIPVGLSSTIGKWVGKSKLGTALRTRELVSKRQSTVIKFLDKMDHIIAVCQWVFDALVINGIPSEKITLCRQELTQDSLQETDERTITEEFVSDRSKVMKLVFLGRLDPTKGVDIVIQAMALIPDLKIVLDIYGVSQGEAGAVYESSLRKMAKSDSRITFKPAVPSSEVIETLKQYSALVVPSRWMETGPLVVLEAFAAGIPVIGSNLGGIRELVTTGMNGFLVNLATTSAWSGAIVKFTETMYQKKQFKIEPIKKKNLVAKKMQIIYETLVRK